MFSRKYILTTTFIALLFTLNSCSKYQKLLKSTDVNEKYEQGFKYYDKGDYYRAVQLFDEIIPYFRATEKAEKIYYAYAYSNYNQGDFMVAGYHFKNYATTFPNSEKTVECAYMAAYCEFQDSPDYYLDQTNTLSAIKSFQLFVNEYPKSKYVEDCNKYIDELRSKLERKSYDVGRLYLQTQEYRAAIVAYKNTLKDYPDTKYKEEILFNILKACYSLASKSIDTKKKERFEEAQTAYNTLVANFPDSKYLSQAESYNKSIIKELNKLKKIS